MSVEWFRSELHWRANSLTIQLIPTLRTGEIRAAASHRRAARVSRARIAPFLSLCVAASLLAAPSPALAQAPAPPGAGQPAQAPGGPQPGGPPQTREEVIAAARADK